MFVAQTGGGVRVAVTGAASSVFRSKPLEDALGKSFTADAAKAVKIDAKGLNGDLHASPEYRAHLDRRHGGARRGGRWLTLRVRRRAERIAQLLIASGRARAACDHDR